MQLDQNLLFLVMNNIRYFCQNSSDQPGFWHFTVTGTRMFLMDSSNPVGHGFFTKWACFPQIPPDPMRHESKEFWAWVNTLVPLLCSLNPEWQVLKWHSICECWDASFPTIMLHCSNVSDATRFYLSLVDPKELVQLTVKGSVKEHRGLRKRQKSSSRLIANQTRFCKTIKKYSSKTTYQRKAMLATIKSPHVCMTLFV